MKGLAHLHRYLLILALLMPMPLWAAAGKVVITAGDVFAVNAQNQRRLLQRRSDVFEGDTLITGTDSNLQLRFEDNAILALRANSQLRISEYHGADGGQERVLMDLLAGGFRTISGNFGKSERDAYQVRTPTASIGIRGTHYEAVFETGTLSVGVYDGGISVTNELGTINLGLDSDFLYAQVQSGNLPQGLLNPPANLNVPSTPQADAASDQEDDGESESDTEEAPDDDLSDLNNDDSLAPSNDPDNTTLPVPDADEISDGDFDFSAIEDEFEEQLDTQDPNSVVALSSSEISALKSDALVTGIMVFAPGESPSAEGPIVVYSAQTGGESIGNVYIAYDTQTGKELDEQFYLPNLVLRPEGQAGTSGVDSGGNNLSESANWEHWNDNNNEVTVEAGSTSDFNSDTIRQPFFFIQAEPTQAKLSGTTTFELCTGCYAVNGMGTISDAAGEMQVDFENLNANGTLMFEGINVWNLAFSGEIEGTVLQASLNNSNIDGVGSLTGNVNGIFTGGSNDLQFAGGFTASDGASNDAYGVFVMNESEP